MTAQTPQLAPQFATHSEREVYDLLARELRPEDVLLANVRLTDEKQDYEVDLLVGMPGAGLVVVEVKGGSISVDEGTGTWHQHRQSGVIEIHPVDQARRGMYALRHYVESDPRWDGRSRVRWGHAVVAPYSDFRDDFAQPDCPRWAVHGRDDLKELAGRLWDIPRAQESAYRVPTEEDVDLIQTILRGRGLPVYDLLAESNERADVADRLTAEQATLLKVTRLLNRVEVRGGAGSGKTILALTQAKELTRGLGGRKPQRVALLCYSKGLAEYFRRQLAGGSRKHRPAFIGTFEDLGRSWGAPEGSREDSDFWENRLPARMAELADGLADGQRFDALIVDEAQDFADLWWTPLMKALRDEETGGLYAYTDENQRIFARFGRPPVPLVPLVLDHNLRNTRQIVDAFSPLAPMRMRPMGGDGPSVRFVSCSVEAALGEADDAVDHLLERGWEPRHVALITTGSRHPQQKHYQETLGQEGYWQTYWDGEDVFYGHVLGCKGLERRAVVLCVNEPLGRDRGRERLYVGLSRATDELVVVGDPEVVRSMGGDAVARTLGL